MYFYSINSYSQTELGIQLKNSLTGRKDSAANWVAHLFDFWHRLPQQELFHQTSQFNTLNL